MKSTRQIIGVVSAFGESIRTGKGRNAMVHFHYIEVRTTAGVVRIESPILVGNVARLPVAVGNEIDILCSQTLQNMKVNQFGEKHGTMVYGMRAPTGEWLGDDVVAELAKGRSQSNAGVVFLVLLSPVVALFTFWAAGVGGLVCLWKAYKARQITKLIPRHDEVILAFRTAASA